MRAILWFTALLTLSVSVVFAQLPPIPRVTHYQLDVHLSPSSHKLDAMSRLQVRNNPDLKQLTFFLNRNLRVKSVRINGQAAQYTTRARFEIEKVIHKIRKDTRNFYANAQCIQIKLPPHGTGSWTVTMAYTGEIYDPPHVPAYARDAAAVETQGVISPKGIFLGPESHWFPEPEASLASHEVITHSPAGWETVTQGKRIFHRQEGKMLEIDWRNEHPSDGLYLIAGKYNVQELTQGSVTVYTYFFPEDSSLAKKYLQYSARYISLYSRLLSPYPYKKFAVVENFFPTGYGMPSYTVLGQTVLRLPFIVYTSLGHEILHNWWGNSVFVDYDTGNWCEGLTMYMADYYYKELRGAAEARAYRYGIDRDYTLYVHPDNDFPLDKFLNRTAMYTRTIGYGKCGMVFHMLRRRIGTEKFYQALRQLIRDKQFQIASWLDIQKEFEAVSGVNLQRFFQQWVHQTGAPRLLFQNGKRIHTGKIWKVTGQLLQKERVFSLHVPVQIYFQSDTLDTVLFLDDSTMDLDLSFGKKPLAMAIDPNYNLMRRLNHDEISPVLSLVLGDAQPLIVLPSHLSTEMLEAYRSLAQQLTHSGQGIVQLDTAVTQAELQAHAIFLLGNPRENSLLKKAQSAFKGKLLFKGKNFEINGRAYAKKSLVAAFWNPWNSRKGLCILIADSPEVVRPLGMKIMHYGKYGYLVFEGAKNLAKGEWPVKHNPLIINF